MATVRPGSKPVLIVVDVQVGVVRNAWEATRVIANVARVVESARADQVPIIWVQHADDELVTGSPDWQWAPPLSPADGETRIHKGFNSSFEATPLDAVLHELGASHIVLAGAMTNWCIRATAYAALERGYDLTLVSDAHTTESMTFDEGASIDAAAVVRDLNIAMQWLRYPGRSNRVVTTEALRFDHVLGRAPA